MSNADNRLRPTCSRCAGEHLSKDCPLKPAESVSPAPQDKPKCQICYHFHEQGKPCYHCDDEDNKWSRKVECQTPASSQPDNGNALLEYLGVAWHRIGNTLTVHMFEPTFKIESLRPESTEYRAHFEMDKAWGKVEKLYSDYEKLKADYAVVEMEKHHPGDECLGNAIAECGRLNMELADLQADYAAKCAELQKAESERERVNERLTTIRRHYVKSLNTSNMEIEQLIERAESAESRLAEVIAERDELKADLLKTATTVDAFVKRLTGKSAIEIYESIRGRG